jgi:hypothetical protein
MTIPMPEPVAYRSKESPYLFSLGGPGTDGFDGLITTTQAEAYADARVREALEQAARACESRIRTGDPGIDTTDVDIEAVACAAAVRNLISSDEYQSDVQAAAGGLTQTPLEY